MLLTSYMAKLKEVPSVLFHWHSIDMGYIQNILFTSALYHYITYSTYCPLLLYREETEDFMINTTQCYILTLGKR